MIKFSLHEIFNTRTRVSNKKRRREKKTFYTIERNKRKILVGGYTTWLDVFIDLC